MNSGPGKNRNAQLLDARRCDFLLKVIYGKSEHVYAHQVSSNFRIFQTDDSDYGRNDRRVYRERFWVQMEREPLNSANLFSGV